MKASLKQFILLSFALFYGLFAKAQSGQSGEQHFVLSSAGSSDAVQVSGQSTGWTIDWTIGELLVEPLSGSKKRLTQGFHQFSSLKQLTYSLAPKSTYIFSALDQDDTQHFSVFPNPFVSNISVQWNFSENLNLVFEIFSLDGKRIYSKRQNAADSQLFIQLQNLKPSTYILRITDPQRNFLETHKLVKF